MHLLFLFCYIVSLDFYLFRVIYYCILIIPKIWGSKLKTQIKAESRRTAELGLETFYR